MTKKDVVFVIVPGGGWGEHVREGAGSPHPAWTHARACQGRTHARRVRAAAVEGPRAWGGVGGVAELLQA